MNATQRKRLLKLADFIVEKVPKHRFDMARYGTMNGELNECGFSGCALGWSTVLFRNIGCYIWKGAPRYKDRTAFGIGISLFGLTQEQSVKLFSGTKVGKSAKQVRRDIIRLVAKLDREAKSK